MQEIVLVIHLILTVSLVILVLLQKSAGGALGIGGGGQGGMMAGRSSANFLTKMTTFLAIGFFATSMSLAVIAKQNTADKSIFDVQTPVVEQTGPDASSETASEKDKTEPVIPDSE